jgi:hypothetical protein
MINQPSNLSHKPMTIPLAHQPITVTLSHQPITITLSLIYHHQPTITRSSHMDTKINTKPCTSTISHVHQPFTIPCINHVPYHTMYQPCIDHVPKPIPSHVHQPCTSTINHVPYHASTMYINLYHTMYQPCIDHVPKPIPSHVHQPHQPCTIPSK